MKLLLKIVLWLVLLIFLALLCWGTTLVLEWPLWIGAVMFIGAVALYFFIKFMRRVILVMRSRSKLAQQSAVGRSQIEQHATPEALLKGKWKAAVALLRSSNLKRLGNPLYVLPWYMVIGKSGTGKTTALTRARLTSPMQKVNQNAPIEQTVNYDWWYFDQAVVIDCAGRYVAAEDVEQDRREWELGMDLLARYRPRHGIDGLVLAISADRLSHPDKDALIAEGGVVRERIEQLIRMFGKRFPIYVLVTKCDQLYGMEEWARQLPDNALEQAMGYLSEEKDAERGELLFLEDAFESIGARLQELRLTLVARSPSVAPGILLFPNELARLKAGMQIFLQACMGGNPYLETPFLRGMFFSSGLQQGGAASALVGDAMVPPAAAHAGANAGLFLHDFFGRILPQDRYSWRPAALANHWRTMTQNLGLLSWILFCLAVGIVITVSFAANMMTLSLVKEARPYDAVFVGKLEPDVRTLQQVNEVLQTVEHRNNDWKTQWMVISTNIDDLEAKLKLSYVQNYRKYIQPAFAEDNKQDFLNATKPGAPASNLAGLSRNLVRHINLLKARQHGADREALRALPQRVRVERYSPQEFMQINELMLSHMAWTPNDDIYFPDHITFLQTQLDRAAYTDPQMTWLTGLTPDNALVKDVRVDDFWSGSGGDDGDTVVPGAFTRAGKEAIDSFLNEMSNSVSDGSQFLTRRAAFESWYREQRMLAWQKFAADFPGAERTLVGEAEWRAALGRITGPQSPYYRLLERLNAEFDNEPEQNLPSWLQLARTFGDLNAQVNRVGATQKAVKIVGAINAVGGKAVKQTLQGAPKAGRKLIDDNMSAADVLTKYLGDINKVAADTVSGQGKSYEIAADFHAFGSPAAKPSPIHSALGGLSRLKQLLGYNAAADDAVWRLIDGPLHFVLTYTEQQASCELQKEWQAKVQWPLQTAPTREAMTDQLYGDKGSVWAFADGMAKPFLERDAKRFRIVQTLGYSMPFTDAFLPMLNNAVDKRVAQVVTQQRAAAEQESAALQAQKDQVQAQQALAQIERDLADIKKKTEAAKLLTAQLTVTGQPSSINPGATSKPFATILTIDCAAAPFQLSNFNFPVSESLSWTPGQCGEVALQIKIDTLILVKRYPGPQGLINFIRDFRGGARDFTADEFPASKARLDALNVTHIGVHYNFDGRDAVLKIAQQLETLDKREKQDLLDQQQVQDAQFKQTEQNIQDKIARQPGAGNGGGSSAPTAEEWLPQQIGVCWDQKNMVDQKQNIQTMIGELASRANGTYVPAPAVAPATVTAPAAKLVPASAKSAVVKSVN
jgi:type VI secretion system protein ImpL